MKRKCCIPPNTAILLLYFWRFNTLKWPWKQDMLMSWISWFKCLNHIKLMWLLCWFFLLLEKLAVWGEMLLLETRHFYSYFLIDCLVGYVPCYQSHRSDWILVIVSCARCDSLFIFHVLAFVATALQSHVNNFVIASVRVLWHKTSDIWRIRFLKSCPKDCYLTILFWTSISFPASLFNDIAPTSIQNHIC